MFDQDLNLVGLGLTYLDCMDHKNDVNNIQSAMQFLNILNLFLVLFHIND